jgi:hypothetical protein
MNFYAEYIPPACATVNNLGTSHFLPQNRAGSRGGITQALSGIKAAGLHGVGLGQIAALTPNQYLDAGQFLYSSTKNCWLTMQHDGNLVVYDAAGQPLWASNTRGSGGVRAIMQTDGNFVVYKSYTSMAPSQAVWASGTYGNPGAWITMQNDGNLVIYSQIIPANPNNVYSAPSDRPLWASNSASNTGLFGVPRGVGLAPAINMASQLAIIAASQATNDQIQALLNGQTDPTNASVISAIASIGTFAPALAAAAVPVTAAITNIQAQSTTTPAAANGATAAVNIVGLLALFAAGTATAASITQLATNLQMLTTTSLQIAATYYAQAIVIDGCPGSTADIALFQNAYNQYSAEVVRGGAGDGTAGGGGAHQSTITVSSALDAPTLAAMETLIPGSSTPLAACTALTSLPPPTPPNPIVVTTAAPVVVAPSNTTTIVVGVVAVAAIGGLIYVMAAKPKT